MNAAVGEAWHGRHLLRVKKLSALTGECPDLGRRANRAESPALDREGFRSRRAVVYWVNLRVDDNEVRVAALDYGRDLHYSNPGNSGSGQAHEFRATAILLPHARFLACSPSAARG